MRQLPDSRLVHVKDLYTAQELKTSPTYNEILRRGHFQAGLYVCLDGPDGSHVSWGLGDPVASDGWGSSEIAMVQGLLPHIRQFIRVRQALVRAKARATTVPALLDNPRIGIIHLDGVGGSWRSMNHAFGLLRPDGRLSDKDGVLCARGRDNQLQLERLVADALPDSAAGAVSASMLLHGSSGLPPYVVHVKPVGIPQPDYGARHVAALVLLVEPGSWNRIDPGVVATTPGVDAGGRAMVAVGLAEGKSVPDIAQATGLSKNTVYWHLQQIYQKKSISRQVDLVRLVLSIAEFG